MNESVAKCRLLDRWKREFPGIDWASVSDAEIVRTIGSRISTFVSGCMRDSGIDWKVKCTAEAAFLSELGVSENDALVAAEEYIKEQRAMNREDGVRRRATVIGRTRIPASLGRNLPVAYVETEYTDLGLKSHPVPIWRFDYRPVEGATASVCPQASPRIPKLVAQAIADGLRQKGAIASNHTIHWLGRARGLEHICPCFRPDITSEKQASNGGPADPSNEWSGWHCAKDWCRLLDHGSRHFARWWKTAGFVEGRDIEMKGHKRRIRLNALREAGKNYPELLKRLNAGEAQRS